MYKVGGSNKASDYTLKNSGELWGNHEFMRDMLIVLYSSFFIWIPISSHKVVGSLPGVHTNTTIIKKATI